MATAATQDAQTGTSTPPAWTGTWFRARINCANAIRPNTAPDTGTYLLLMACTSVVWPNVEAQLWGCADEYPDLQMFVPQQL
jgi:hypothetical protein